MKKEIKLNPKCLLLSHLEVQSCSNLTQNLFLLQQHLSAALSGASGGAGVDVVVVVVVEVVVGA